MTECLDNPEDLRITIHLNIAGWEIPELHQWACQRKYHLSMGNVQKKKRGSLLESHSHDWLLS